jgi:copper chaperone CopZ
MAIKEFKVSGLNCQHCVGKVQNIIGSVEGVKHVTVLKDEQQVKIDADPMPDLESLNLLLQDQGHYRLSY